MIMATSGTKEYETPSLNPLPSREGNTPLHPSQEGKYPSHLVGEGEGERGIFGAKK